MKHRLRLTLLISPLLAAVVMAQDEPPRPQNQEPPAQKADPKKKVDDLPPIKELEKKEPAAPATDAGDPQRIQKIVERLNKNMDSSEERLNKKDPGEETRKIQENIIKDLDELIKQAGNGGGGGGGGGMGGIGGGGGGGGKVVKRSSGKTGGQSKGTQQANNKGDSQDKDKGEQTGKDGPGKEGKGGGGMGGNPDAKDKKDKNTIEDLFKDVWGHLPQNKRQEMDAYAKERFLRKYDEILRQYYRTISEQGRRKDGD